MANENLQFQPYENYTCDEITDLIGAYSIGATTPAESRAIQAMLPYCPDAMAELAEYVAVSDAMLHLFPMDEEPPQDLLGKLNLGDAQPNITEFPTHHHIDHRPAHHIANGDPQLVPLPAAQPEPTPHRNTGLWLGLVAMFLVVIAMNAVWYGLFRNLQNQQAQLTSVISTQQDQISQSAARPVSAFPFGANTQLVALNPTTENTPNAVAFVVLDASGQVGQLYVDGLPEPPAGQGYQMWLVRDNVDHSLGTFRLETNGQGNLVFQSPVPIQPSDVIGISTEPAVGSDVPTTPHLVTGQIS